jgi:hypothetical protein
MVDHFFRFVLSGAVQKPEIFSSLGKDNDRDAFGAGYGGRGAYFEKDLCIIIDLTVC